MPVSGLLCVELTFGSKRRGTMVLDCARQHGRQALNRSVRHVPRQIMGSAVDRGERLENEIDPFERTLV